MNDNRQDHDDVNEDQADTAIAEDHPPRRLPMIEWPGGARS